MVKFRASALLVAFAAHGTIAAGQKSKCHVNHSVLTQPVISSVLSTSLSYVETTTEVTDVQATDVSKGDIPTLTLTEIDTTSSEVVVVAPTSTHAPGSDVDTTGETSTDKSSETDVAATASAASANESISSGPATSASSSTGASTTAAPTTVIAFTPGPEPRSTTTSRARTTTTFTISEPASSVRTTTTRATVPPTTNRPTTIPPPTTRPTTVATTKSTARTTTGITTTTTTAPTTTSSAPSGNCTTPKIRLTSITVTSPISTNEDEATLKPLAIAPLPSGGSRLAYMGTDNKLHVITLTSADTIDTSVPSVTVAVHDFADILADEKGFVVLGTRDAQGGGTLNCGNPANLCGTAPSPAIPCYDMYLIRYEYASGKEVWSTKLTDSGSALPPYSTSATGPNVYFVWWYAHHGRLAIDSSGNYAAYFGAAISVSQSGCINIHQGDRMQVVSPSGTLLTGHNSFAWGCSHSGYERIVWDERIGQFVTVCKTDNQNRITFAPSMSPTIRSVDLSYSDFGDLVLDSGTGGGGYWLTTSDIQSGQPTNSDGVASVYLLHFTKSGGTDKTLTLASSTTLNARAPHLASYMNGKYLLAAWETSTAKGELTQNDRNRKMYVQVRDAGTGTEVSGTVSVDVVGNRYQAWKSFGDGSVGYAAGNGSTGNKVIRVLPCA
ncbi:hypothetical protein HDV00_010070 [Rhizophlyctis rosea]|nr:hypothetical protein HDV00_010070 [Rhizophlyctis rosea]